MREALNERDTGVVECWTNAGMNLSMASRPVLQSPDTSAASHFSGFTAFAFARAAGY